MSFLNLFLFILQIIVAVLLIFIVLIQSSDEDSLSGIGAGAGKTNFLSHKTSVDLVTRTTIFLGVVLMLNSFVLTSISTHKYNKNLIKDYIKQKQDEQLDIKQNNTTSQSVTKQDNQNIENN